VLAPCAGWRDQVIPGGPHPGDATRAGRCRNAPDEEADSSGPAGNSRPLRRYPWADLLRRVFALDVLECPDCGGRMRILSAIHPPEATRAILQSLGLPSRAPPIAPARPDPEFAEPAPSDGRTGCPPPPGEGPSVSAAALRAFANPVTRPPAQLESSASPGLRPAPPRTVDPQVDGIGLTGPKISA
jgi:hypothetical protein